MAGAWCDFLQRPLRMVVLGTGDPACRRACATSQQQRPRPLRGALRVRRGPGPQGHGRGRHLPDALAQRALRPHPDVRAALRHGPDRALDRAASWTRWSRTTRRRATGTGFRFDTPGRHRAHVGASTRRSPPARTRRRWAAPDEATACRGISRGSARPASYVELYERARADGVKALRRPDDVRELETFTDQNWAKEVLGSDKPVLVDFWAEWCEPCMAMVPDLEAVAAPVRGPRARGEAERRGERARSRSSTASPPCPPCSSSRAARSPSSASAR